MQNQFEARNEKWSRKQFAIDQNVFHLVMD